MTAQFFKRYTVRVKPEQARLLDDFCDQHGIRPPQLLRLIANQVANGRFSICASMLSDLTHYIHPPKDRT